MKTGLTIQQMAQELLRQSKAKQDYLVNTGSLSLSVTSDAPQLRVTENGLDKITPLDIRQTAHRQLGTYLGIPQKYYELMRTDAPELLAYNANYWFSQKNELRTLRTMDGCARAFLSNRYRRIDNLDIASVTLPVIGELPEARFVSTQITDDFMYIKVVNPRLQADVVPGDVVQAGVIISNSETGLGSVTIQPLIYRLVCSNGMVINDAKTRRNHVGRAATSEEDFSIYSNETLLADDHAFVLKIKDTVRAAISEARFAQVVSRMRESTEATLDTKQLPAIVKLASSSFGITEDESNGVLEHLITGGDFSLYGLANAVTRFSQDVESYDRATKLEEIGYSVKVECYPNTPAIKVQLLPVNAGERITMTQNLGQPLPRYQAFLCDGMLEVDSTAFMDYMEENDLGYIVDYKRYDADVFTGVNRRTAAVFQFHSAALCRLNKVGCQRYEGDYTRLKQKHAERRARLMAG